MLLHMLVISYYSAERSLISTLEYLATTKQQMEETT